VARLARVGLLVALAAAALLFASSRRRGNLASPAHHATWVAAGTLRLRALVAGAGRPIVLLHGYGESLVAWRGVFDSLTTAGRVVAFDLPGSGLSDKPATGYSAESMADWIAAAMQSLNLDSAVIVGHSLGGAIAAAIAVRHPAAVRGLVLVDPAAVLPPEYLPDPGSSRQLAASMRSAIAEYESLRPHFFSPHDSEWMAEPDTAAASYVPQDDESYVVALQSVLSEFDFAWLSAARADSVRVPTLVLWGEYDQLFPRRLGARLVEALPDARLQVVERSWHRPHVERPAVVSAAIVQFLDTL